MRFVDRSDLWCIARIWEGVHWGGWFQARAGGDRLIWARRNWRGWPIASERICCIVGVVYWHWWVWLSGRDEYMPDSPNWGTGLGREGSGKGLSGFTMLGCMRCEQATPLGMNHAIMTCASTTCTFLVDSLVTICNRTYHILSGRHCLQGPRVAEFQWTWSMARMWLAMEGLVKALIH